MSSLETTKRIISECLLIPASSIQADDQIAQLKNIDSLAFEMIVVAIETETGKAVAPTDLIGLQTVQQLAKLLD